MKTIEDFKRNKSGRRSSGKFLDQIALYTGNPPKTYKRGDAHPFVQGLVYRNWIRNKEFWCTPDNLEAYVERQRIWNQSEAGRRSQLKYNRSPQKKELNARYNKTDKNKKCQKRYRNTDSRKISNRRYSSRRRAMIKDSLESLSVEDELIIKHYFDWSVRLEGKLGVKFEVDHIVPLTSGGFHHPQNLQIAPRVWNRRKGNRNTNRWLPNGL
jgi:hypothetical protein